MKFRWMTLMILSVAALSCGAQIQSGAPAAPKPVPGSIASHPGWPVAKPEDVQSVDAIIASLYDVISGPAGKARDWDRFRSLFVPDARLIPVRPPKPEPGSHTDIAVFSPDDYVQRSSPLMLQSGFFERGIASRVEAFGNMAHVWTTYESRHTAADPQPFARGINSVTLLKDGNRYWIVQVLWDSERPGSPIPEKYLQK